MAKSRPPYSPEFRQQMVELVRSGRTPSELAREFEPSAQTIGTWVRQAAKEADHPTDGLTRDSPLNRGNSKPTRRMALTRRYTDLYCE